MMRKIYCDHSATTPVAPEVFSAMEPFFKNKFGNPSSLHGFGQEVKTAIEYAREQVAALINADPGEIVFPVDAGVVDVTQPPYNAKGDGKTDATRGTTGGARGAGAGADPGDRGGERGLAGK